MKTPLIVLFVISVIILSAAEKRVGGIVARDTRWNAEDGPFILEKDLIIPRYIRLIISPGTKIVVARVPLQDTSLYQLDKIDETSVSIKVEGVLSCVGRSDNKITFSPEQVSTNRYGWYGIVYGKAEKEGNEISHTDITGAYVAVTTLRSNVLIYRSVVEYNHIGMFFSGVGEIKVINCIVGFNMLSGIRVVDANPSIVNSIIVGNRNNGIFCDGRSKVTLEYNCFNANADGDFLDCDPEFGVLTKKNSGGDSTDYASNMFLNPVFAGSPADSLAAYRDVNTPTDKSTVKSSLIADIISTVMPPRVSVTEQQPGKRYSLSKYSPCIDGGNSADYMKDKNGSRNDIGVYGGPEFINK